MNRAILRPTKTDRGHHAETDAMKPAAPLNVVALLAPLLFAPLTAVHAQQAPRWVLPEVDAPRNLVLDALGEDTWGFYRTALTQDTPLPPGDHPRTITVGGLQRRYLLHVPPAAAAGVVFVAIEGQGHVWPGGKNLLPELLVGRETGRLKAVDVIWDFFKAHALDTSASSSQP
jgi:hypothetical protein